jgi:RNA polymerase sigma-70 factor, ECF subfamily
MQAAPSDAAQRDSDIVRLLRGGAQQQAFALLLDRYEHKLYRLCRSLLRDPTRAEDAAQESLVRIWKALPGYDGRASLSTWIYTITRNRCLTALARQRELTSVSEPEVDVESISAEVADADDQSALLREFVDALPERQRSALVLYYYEDRSVNEVAEMLAIPEGTVKTTLHRARAALLERLRRRGLDSAGFWLEQR